MYSTSGETVFNSPGGENASNQLRVRSRDLLLRSVKSDDPCGTTIKSLKMAAAASPDIINWEEAMQQVGEDEEFLRELLSDLRSETETQLVAIASIIQVRSCPGSWLLFRVLNRMAMSVLRHSFVFLHR